MAPHRTPHRAGALLLAVCCALTAACAPLEALTGAGDTATSAAPLSTAGTVGESVVLGTGVPRPTPSAPAPAPTVTRDVTSVVTVTAAAEPTAGADATVPCADLVSHRVVRLGVKPVVAPGSATVTWYSRESPSLLGWRVAAVRQDLVSGEQPPPVWVDVAAPAGCAEASATVTGLTSGSHYELWLHRVVDDGTGPDPLVEMVGRSSTVTVP